MPVSKRRKQKQRRRDPAGPVLVRHPFSQIPRDLLVKRLAEFGESTASAFPGQLKECIETIQKSAPLQTIATLASYGLMGGVEEDGTIKRSFLGDEFNQAHVELVQAIALLSPLGEQGSQTTSDTIQKLFDLLPPLGRAYSERRFRSLGTERPKEEKALALLQEHLRLHTQVVRNWGFYSDVVRITSDLLRPIDSVVSETIGIGGTELISVFHSLVLEKEEKATARMERMRQVFRQPSVPLMIRRYYELNPQLKDKPEDLMKFVADNGLSTDQLKALILTHSDLLLPNDLMIDVPGTAAKVKVSEGALCKALDQLSLRFGELYGRDPEYFFLDNPVWEKPVIKLDGQEYFCALPQAFFSFVFPILDSLISKDPQAAKTYSRRRAEYLEQEIERVCRSAFPDCEIAAGYNWKEGDDEFENDLLLRVDTHLVIVEAKSGSVSWSALRGAPQRAKKHVEELLLAPSHQSLRLQQRIVQAVGNIAEAGMLLPQFPIDLAKVRNVLRLSVTLEDFAVLQTNLQLAREVGWSAPSHKVAPCILLADLQVIFEVLDLTALKIHYLKRRAEIQENMSYHGDELDLLGLYLDTGFNIGNAEFEDNHFELTMMSKTVDAYFIARDEGVERAKPRPKLTSLWRDVCERLESRNFHGWSDVAVVLLAFSFDDQKKMEKGFKHVRKNVAKSWRDPKHLCTAIMIPNRHRSDALMFYAFRDRDKQHRHARMENLASHVFEAPHVDRCVVLAVNIDTGDYPYSTLGVFTRKHRPEFSAH